MCGPVQTFGQTIRTIGRLARKEHKAESSQRQADLVEVPDLA